MYRILISGAVIMGLCVFLASHLCAAEPAEVCKPVVAGNFGAIPDLFKDYDVILEPEKNEAEWWAGAPSVARGDDGVFWLACRMRTADSPRGLRGYELRILRSEDGVHFEQAHVIRREDVPIQGFERPALLRDPKTGRFKLYACGPWRDGPWSIIKFADADTPAQFAPASAYPVITPPERAYERDIAPHEYKDPVVVYANGTYHCFVIGYIRRNERIFHFESPDGEQWTPVGSPYESVMPLSGWHDFFVRPASILPLGIGYLFVYEGSSARWYDPVYNIATGLAFTFDLRHLTDLTPESPLIISSTPSEHFATFRYSDWLWVENEVWVYAEVARPNQSHEIRRYRLKAKDTLGK